MPCSSDGSRLLDVPSRCPFRVVFHKFLHECFPEIILPCVSLENAIGIFPMDSRSLLLSMEEKELISLYCSKCHEASTNFAFNILTLSARYPLPPLRMIQNNQVELGMLYLDVWSRAITRKALIRQSAALGEQPDTTVWRCSSCSKYFE